MIAVQENADPLLSCFTPIRSGKLTSVATSSSILIKSIPHLYKLAQYPVVIHVSVQPSSYPDYSDITSIRQCGLSAMPLMTSSVCSQGTPNLPLLILHMRTLPTLAST